MLRSCSISPKKELLKVPVDLHRCVFAQRIPFSNLNMVYQNIHHFPGQVPGSNILLCDRVARIRQS